MSLLARAFPVRDRAGVDTFVDAMKQRQDEARYFYTALGVRREAWFFQRCDNALVIGVTEVDGPLEERAAAFAAASDAFSSWFKAQIDALSGIDPSLMPLGPRSEWVFASSVEPFDHHAPLIVRAYPLRSREALDELLAELQQRRDETEAFYRRHEVRETWFVQDMGEGPFAIAVAAMRDPSEQARLFAADRDPFAVWFKQRVMSVSGVNPNETPLGPRTELLYEFQR
ncbi:MAG TPA: hypothetical protein VGR02_14610 [Thermoanaerobaculia bacterium]|jgi:hypothetical protein|nr:hypothetical protein [Thermoanaerobaculia bacterium]